MSTVKSSSENLTLNADGAGSDVVIQNNGTETVRVDSSGNVGIGITHTPTATLEVAGRIHTGQDSTHYGRILGGNAVLYIGHRNDTADGSVLFGGFGGGTFNEFGRFNSNGNLLVNNQILFNSGYGSAAVAYGCRAWIKFNTIGTVSVSASGNVSSITDNGVGETLINFSNAMPDAHYAVSGAARDTNTNTFVIGTLGLGRSDSVKSTTQFEATVFQDSNGTLIDVPEVNVVIHR